MEFELIVIQDLTRGSRGNLSEIEPVDEDEFCMEARKFLVVKRYQTLVLLIGPVIDHYQEYLHADLARVVSHDEKLGGGKAAKVKTEEKEFLLLWDQSTFYGECYELLQQPAVAEALKKAVGLPVVIEPERRTGEKIEL